MDNGELTSFNLCPGSQFSFNNATNASFGPVSLRLETPLCNPITLHCLAGPANSTNPTTYAFNGGDTPPD